jgi:hypothetical protein
MFAAMFALPAFAQVQNLTPTDGPDVIVGFVFGTRVFGQDGAGPTRNLGISASTNSCNRGSEPVNWHELPDPRHPVIAVNFYRLSGDKGRMEQLGQAWVKHGILATNQTEGSCGGSL